MAKLLLNARKLSFQNTLGVTAVCLNLARELARRHDITLVVAPDSDWQACERADAIADFASSILTVEEAKAARSRFFAHVEICPHHFQEPEFCRDSILICHDLHIFDIPWKYPDIDVRQAKFKKTMQQASAVVTHFPRTYYKLERTIGASIRNLFLTEAPLMFDPARQATGAANPRPRTLLFPAQLQAYKGHKALIEGAKQLAVEGEAFELLFCGTDFERSITDGLIAMVQELELTRHVRFLGRVTDAELANLYRDCSGVITASAAEGGAYIPVEALSCGKPVAVNDIESARMHLKALRADVIWFDASNPASTVDAMRKLLNADADAFARRNETARRRIASLSWGEVADKWTNIIRYLKRETPRPIQSLDGDGWRVELQ